MSILTNLWISFEKKPKIIRSSLEHIAKYFSPILRCSKNFDSSNLEVWMMMVSSSENTLSHLPKRPRSQKSKMKKKPAAAGCRVTMSLSFVFSGGFLQPLWIKFRRFLVSVSSNKMVTLDIFYVSLKLFFFSESHHLFYFFTWTFLCTQLHSLPDNGMYRQRVP